jgi:hypothetical protein
MRVVISYGHVLLLYSLRETSMSFFQFEKTQLNTRDSSKLEGVLRVSSWWSWSWLGCVYG